MFVKSYPLAVKFLQALRAESFRRRAVTNQFFIQAQNAVRESVDHAHIVSNENNGQISFFFYLVQKIKNSFFPADVNSGRRLVKKQDIGIADQTPGDKNSLKLSGRYRSYHFFKKPLIRYAHGSQGFFRRFSSRFFHSEKFLHGKRQIFFRQYFLRDITDFCAFAPFYFSLIRQYAQERFEQNGFAGAVGTHYGDILPFLEVKT